MAKVETTTFFRSFPSVVGVELLVAELDNDDHRLVVVGLNLSVPTGAIASLRDSGVAATVVWVIQGNGDNSAQGTPENPLFRMAAGSGLALENFVTVGVNSDISLTYFYERVP